MEIAKNLNLWQERTEVLLGIESQKILQQSTVLIVGVGGVGGMVAEMLGRAGVGNLILVDADKVALSNINRQLIALHTTVGMTKVDLWKERLLQINPSLQITTHAQFLTPENLPLFFSPKPTIVVDAIDSITPKVSLIAHCLKHKIPIISSMGAGAKDDLTQVQFADLWQTYHCGLSKAVRTGLTKIGLKGRKLPVVFSAQQANPKALIHLKGERNKKTSAGTISYMPAIFGCYISQWVVKKILSK